MSGWDWFPNAVHWRFGPGELTQVQFPMLGFGKFAAGGATEPAAEFQLPPERLVGVPLVNQPLHAVLFGREVGIWIHEVQAGRRHRPIQIVS